MTGIDTLLKEPERYLAGERAALLSSEAAVTKGWLPVGRALQALDAIKLKMLLAPEHGWSAYGADATFVEDGLEPHLKLPVYSLYGPRRRAPAELLAQVDLVVVDLQDVGVRCYTYATTLALLLESAAATGTRVLLCDRPNPLGSVSRGPMLDVDLRSFLGYLPVPYQHGLTLGELARYYNEYALSGAVSLEVVPHTSGSVGARADGPWIPPSPGLPRLEAVHLYPGLVLLEAVNLSEGRGTTLPFELIGAPWLDAYHLADAIGGLGLAGVLCRPASFTPESGKFAGERCRGLHLHIRPGGDALELAFNLFAILNSDYRSFRFRSAAEVDWGFAPSGGGSDHEPTEGYLVDHLLGDVSFRRAVEGAARFADVSAAWRRNRGPFADRKSRIALYPVTAEGQAGG